MKRPRTNTAGHMRCRCRRQGSPLPFLTREDELSEASRLGEVGAQWWEVVELVGADADLFAAFLHGQARAARR